MGALEFFTAYLGISAGSLIGYGSAFLALVCASQIKIKPSKEREKEEGMATKEEISHKLDNEEGVQLSKRLCLATKYAYEHILIMGPTGSGKTSSFIMTNLLKNIFNKGESSIVSVDTKGDVFNTTAKYQKSIGRQVKVFAPCLDNMEDMTIHYNPLTFCKNDADIITLAHDILISGTKAIEAKDGSKGEKDATWINFATPLFASLLLYVNSLGKPHNTIANAIRIRLDNSDDELNELLGNHDNENIRIQFKSYYVGEQAGGMIGSIKSTLTSNVQFFLNPEIEKLTAYSDFTFEEIKKKKTALYIVYPDEKACDLAPLTSLFFGHMFSAFKKCNSKKNYPVLCMFDEFANVGKIPNFDSHASLLRYYRVALCVATQDKNQLKALYGTKAETIFNNFKTTVLLPGLKDTQTLKDISELSGTVEVERISESVDSAGKKTKNKSTIEKPLFTMADLRCLKDNEIFIMIGNEKPIVDEVDRYFNNVYYLNNAI